MRSILFATSETLPLVQLQRTVVFVTKWLRWRKRWVKLRSLEAVTEAPNCGQKYRFIGFCFNLFTQSPHMDVNRPRRSKMLLAPNLAQQLLARKSVAGVSDKEFQQFKFSGSQFHLFIVLVNTAGGLIEAERTERNLGRFRRRLGFRAPQMGLDARDQFARRTAW